jgi:hypothetical protein
MILLDVTLGLVSSFAVVTAATYTSTALLTGGPASATP